MNYFIYYLPLFTFIFTFGSAVITEIHVLKIKNDGINNKEKNKQNIGVILSYMIVFLLVIISLYDSYYINNINNLNYLSYLVGTFLAFTGLIVRIYSIRTLGKNFSYLVLLKNHQSLITDGIYKKIRHPSYLGAIMLLVGCSFILSSVYGIILSLMISLAYIPRIKMEEKLLISKFPKEYSKYSIKAWKLIPYIY